MQSGTTALATIGSLWVGAELSWLEQLCLKSFLDHGHKVVLFTYGAVKGVPDGVQIAHANEILPSDRIITHAKTGSPAYHADMFRLHMLKETDFVWADTDAFCCRPWKRTDNHFHGWISDDKPLVNNGVLGLPRDSMTLAAMLEFTSDEYPIPPWYDAEHQANLRAAKERGQGTHVSLLPWGVWGPNAITWFLKETGEIVHSLAPHMLYPIPFKNAGFPLNPARSDRVRKLLREDTLSIHFWGRRFRNIAAKYDGVPAEGSLMRELLERHGIDPMKTHHLLKGQEDVNDTQAPDLDFSVFSDADVANLILQRSEIATEQEMIRDWMAGNDAPLLTYAARNRDRILKHGYEIAGRECAIFWDAADEISPERFADIGCGYAFADLHAYRRYGCDIVLIDIETGGDRHFGFQTSHPGYTSLNTAREFLVKNGVPEEKITIVNPNVTKIDSAGSVDLAISLASCGFHYPVTIYREFFHDQISDRGGIVLDIRKGSGGIAQMKEFGEVQVLAKHEKYSTVLTRKQAKQ